MPLGPGVFSSMILPLTSMRRSAISDVVVPIGGRYDFFGMGVCTCVLLFVSSIVYLTERLFSCFKFACASRRLTIFLICCVF
jgi:hypothetical protein